MAVAESVDELEAYRGLAEALGAPFLRNRVTVAPAADLAQALRTGIVPLADGRRLLAPCGGGLDLVAAARQRPGDVVTSPERLAVLLGEQCGPALERATGGLSLDAPALSARGVLTRRKACIGFAMALVGFAALGLGSRIAADLLAIIFFAAQAFRLLVSAAGLPVPQPEQRPLRDGSLPTYSVLVPLRNEAAMAPGLVAALERLDYPRAKLEILFLTESDDPATRSALAAAGLSPHMRMIVVPPGAPQTKPRALNAGLFVARGALVTVFDAEDRPAADQLRRAAARFAARPDLACLQARLAVSNGDEGLLPRLFAVEYAALFDVFNVGVVRRGLPVALGGTSNHFRGMGQQTPKLVTA